MLTNLPNLVSPSPQHFQLHVHIYIVYCMHTHANANVHVAKNGTEVSLFSDVHQSTNAVEAEGSRQRWKTVDEQLLNVTVHAHVM